MSLHQRASSLKQGGKVAKNVKCLIGFPLFVFTQNKENVHNITIYTWFSGICKNMAAKATAENKKTN